MLDGVRFIHTGDLHLGSPLKAVGEISERLKKSLIESSYTAIKNIVDAALNHNVDFILMCGDIYDNEARSVKGNRFLTDQMKLLNDKNIPVFIIYGNHDPIGKSIDFFDFPDNVKILGAETVEMCEITAKSGKIRARILGQSYGAPSESRKIHLNYRPPEDNFINIAMLHTGLDPGSNAYVPCSLEELKNQSGIHYWALGHIHSPEIINDNNPVIAYPGIPQGRDVGETGLKGCFLVQAESPDLIELEFIPTSPVIWLVHRLSIDSYTSLNNISDLADLLIEEGRRIIDTALEVPSSCPIIDNNFKPEGYVIRWEICGKGSIHDDLISGRESDVAEELEKMLNQHLSSMNPYLWTESIKLHTGSPIPDLELLLAKDEILKTLYTIKQKIRENADLKENAISTMGNIWYKPRGEDDLRDDTFPVTAEKFDSLLENAFNLAVERIFKEREDY
ncbi:MAG: DNA repair exonuclease [Alkaliphilus sp.]|nr:DNA repair exonuclease [Alkaliphilus sp.]